MFWKMLILVSENGEVACMDTTLHWLQQPFFLVSQFSGFVVFLCFTLPMFRLLFPHWHFVSLMGGDFSWPRLVRTFFRVIIKNGTTIWDSNQNKYKYKFYGNFLRGSHFPYLHWFGVGNVIMTPMAGWLGTLGLQTTSLPVA